MKQLSRNLLGLLLEYFMLNDCFRFIQINKKFATTIINFFKLTKKIIYIFKKMLYKHSFSQAELTSNTYKISFDLFLIKEIQTDKELEFNKFNDNMKLISERLPKLSEEILKHMGIIIRKKLSTTNFPLQNMKINKVSIIGDSYELDTYISVLNKKKIFYNKLSFIFDGKFDKTNCLYIANLNLQNLTELFLSNCNINQEIMKEFSMINFNRLMELDLSNNQIDVVAMKYFCEIKFPALRNLNLNENKIDLKAIKFFIGMYFPNLIMLFLSYNLFDKSVINLFSSKNFPRLVDKNIII
jgi:hypothetical protein